MAIDRAEAARRGQGRSHQARYFAPDTKAGAQVRGSITGALQQLRDDVQTQALRSAVYAGAKLLADELERRVPVDDGQLKGAVYTWHDDKRSRDGRQLYVVGVNKKQAPHWFNVEYGHWRINVVYRVGNRVIPTKQRLPTPVWTPAHPYLRPTADRMPDAVRAMQLRLIERIRELRAGQAAPEAAAP